MHRIARPPLFTPALLAALVAACTASTGEERTSFEVEASGPDALETWTNEMGWDVTVTTAALSLGPVYFFEGEPLFARATIWDRLLGIRVAHAHPGHYQEGDALAQILESTVVDLTSAEPTSLGLAEGVTGDYRSARVGIHTPSPDAPLDGHTLAVAGTATDGVETVPFTTHLDLDLDVEGIAFDHDVDGSPGRVHITVDVQRWLERADFTGLAPTGTEPVVLEEGMQPWNALVRGVDNTSALIITWKEE